MLSRLLSVPVREIRAALSSNQYYSYQPIPVATDVSQKVVAYIAEHPQDFPGVSWMQASVRQYPYGSLAAHILGSVGQIQADQLKDPRFKGYGPSDIVGRSGLEVEYERWLRGRPGVQKYLVNAASKTIRTLGGQDPVPGDDLRLYLDLSLQQIVEKKLRDGIMKARNVIDPTNGQQLKATAGAAIVLDPHTFGIEAIASYPTFNPEWFVGGLSQRRYKLLTQPRAQFPLLNRPTQAQLAPGSTFKPFIALSALHNGIASLGGSYDCPATYTFPGDTSHTVFHNWDPANTGLISLSKALSISCDTVFYGFGGQFYSRFYANNQLGSGAEPLQRDLRGFGFGRDTGVDLPAEAPGLIPTAAWKQQYAPQHPELFHPDEVNWLPGDDINMAIGQGFVAVTPLQLASAYAAIANGGRLCAPRLARDVQLADGTVVHRIGNGGCKKLPYTAAQLSYVRHALAGVVQPGGTAGTAFAGFPFSQVAVEGKTGTAERAPLQDTSWFAAMVGGTVDDPQHIILVMVEQGGHGSTTAAPIVRSIIESMYKLNSTGRVGGSATD
ncbi:MAG: penicillin-binding protein 2 [Actinobacteria bacterium]|nr:penicillin-binding protein 2 [Actinomycetota bacterium]